MIANFSSWKNLSENTDSTDIRQQQHKYLNNPLNDKSKIQAASYIHKKVSNILDGFFKDDSWLPVNNLFKLLNDEGIDFDFYQPSQYFNFPYKNDGLPRKEWYLVFNFINDKKRPTEMYGRVIAASADENFDRYDLTFTVN